jgi:chloramphenicol-sensitive protein RarD
MPGQEIDERAATARGAIEATAPAVSERPVASERSVAGLLFGLATYVYWGFQPLYFKLVQSVPPAVLVAHRTAWCAIFMVLLLTALRSWGDFLRCAASKRLLLLLTCSSLLLATNWLIYIASVVNGQMVETSLGYYINPLFSVFLGIVFLHERPGRLQTVAILLAALGIAYLVCRLAYVPWLALGVAGTFGLYGLVRKVARVESLTGLTLETLLLFPLAAGYLAWQSISGTDIFGGFGGGGRVLVLASGAITAIPLLFFGAAARRLPLSTLGFLQFVSPSLQLALAVLAYGEPFTFHHAVSFGLIWIALALFTAETVLSRRRMREAIPQPPAR